MLESSRNTDKISTGPQKECQCSVLFDFLVQDITWGSTDAMIEEAATTSLPEQAAFEIDIEACRG